MSLIEKKKDDFKQHVQTLISNGDDVSLKIYMKNAESSTREDQDQLQKVTSHLAESKCYVLNNDYRDMLLEEIKDCEPLDDKRKIVRNRIKEVDLKNEKVL